ncbi:MAG: sel1 repeat family protein [Bacilli bacterium]|nr:sel1 repeat family protein [Bacilli bacterium]
MNETTLLDKINIKTYPELIINYFKENNINTNITNLRSFYYKLLDSINVDIRDSYLNRILKYLSSKEESTILILEDIKDNIYKKELVVFFEELNNIILNNSTNSFFYKNLLENCSFIFFEDEELNIINNLYSNKKYGLLLYELFIHACKNYKINTPKITAERLLNNSYCLYDDADLKPVLIKTSADLGNDIACELYGNIVYSDHNERLIYFLKGRNNPQNLWEIGFIIEHFEISENQLTMLKKELKNIFDEGSKYMQNIIVTNQTNSFNKECISLALEIYLYLANEKNNSKGLCSVGKFFLGHKVAIIENNKIDEEKSIQMGIDYSFKAVRLGNVHAMQNIGTYFYKNKKENEEYKYKELLQIGADVKDLLSCVYLTKVLIDENKIEEAEKYLKIIVKQKDGESLYRLGKIYETRLQTQEAIKYYKDAISNNYYIASIDLAKLYFTEYMNNSENSNIKNGYLLLAINVLENNYNKYEEKEKKEANELLNNFKSLI